MPRTIRIQDTLTKSLRELEPREPGRVGIYACGPTVYSRVHVGNARPYVVFSLFKRFLEHEGYDVTFVANVTDVNDKIYDAAREAGVPSEQLASEMTDAYMADTDRLGLGRPDHEPKASETIEPIEDLIQALIDSGHAYEAGGDVYFRVASFDGYGKLSHRNLEEMDQGEPDDRSELKESPHDFALWKAQKPDEDTAWDAPWGRGRPGWHIECSAMAEEILGLDFDVHGGGVDLVFPHHENEIAQTEAGRHRPLARLWMHNGMVRFDEEKMAKSVGNVTLLGDALDRHGRDALLMYFLRGHYRQPLAYSDELVEDAARAVERIANFCRSLRSSEPDPAPRPSVESHREA
ncbi:MAG: cysteine--tRNA ligase, partial [Gaiellaceae bacterium]